MTKFRVQTFGFFSLCYVRAFTSFRVGLSFFVRFFEGFNINNHYFQARPYSFVALTMLNVVILKAMLSIFILDQSKANLKR